MNLEMLYSKFDTVTC